MDGFDEFYDRLLSRVKLARRGLDRRLKRLRATGMAYAVLADAVDLLQRQASCQDKALLRHVGWLDQQARMLVLRGMAQSAELSAVKLGLSTRLISSFPLEHEQAFHRH